MCSSSLQNKERQRKSGSRGRVGGKIQAISEVRRTLQPRAIVNFAFIFCTLGYVIQKTLKS